MIRFVRRGGTTYRYEDRGRGLVRVPSIYRPETRVRPTTLLRRWRVRLLRSRDSQSPVQWVVELLVYLCLAAMFWYLVEIL